MQFTVPQFIERKTKIVGILTFQQLIVVVVAGAICFVLYYTLPLAAFIVSSIFIGTIAGSLAFGQINKTPLPIIIKNFLKFSSESKLYLWQKKTPTIKLIEKKEEKIIKEKQEQTQSTVSLKHSKLNALYKKLETKTR